MYQCFALAFSYICLSDWISIVNGLFTVVYCVYIVLLDFLKFLLKSAEPTHPHSGTKMDNSSKTHSNKFSNQPNPTQGRKCHFYRMALLLLYRTNPTPLGDENCNSSKCAILYAEPTQPHSGTKIIASSRLVNLLREPTHPQAGTKITVS